MKQKIFFSLIFFVVILIIGVISAVPAAPSPLCNIEAFILNSTYVQAYFQSETPCNVKGMAVPARYLLDVEILYSEGIIAGVSHEECRNLYHAGSKSLLTVLNIPESTNFQKNFTIQGTIHFTGDECENGIYLTNYTIKEPVCHSDSDCPLGTCPDGNTYKASSCYNDQCSAIRYLVDPCMTNNPEICTQPDNFTCCKGDKCLTGDWNCKQGTKLVFAGCNSECNPEAECQEINTGFFQKFINWFKNLFS